MIVCLSKEMVYVFAEMSPMVSTKIVTTQVHELAMFLIRFRMMMALTMLMTLAHP